MPITPKHTAKPKDEIYQAVFDELSKLVAEASPNKESIVECAYDGDIIYLAEVSREIITKLSLSDVKDGKVSPKEFAEDFFSRTNTGIFHARRKAAAINQGE